MQSRLSPIKREQWIGILFVVGLHLACFYALWRYRVIPTPEEAVTLLVSLAAQPAESVKQTPKSKPITVAPPQQSLPLAVETPLIQPNDAVVEAPPPAPAPVAPSLTQAPEQVQLTGELSASCPDRPAPKYPGLSVRLNEQGKVVLQVELDSSGNIVNVRVRTRSGFPRLDEAAVSAIKNWHCNPASKNGVAVAAVALQPFNFVLE